MSKLTRIGLLTIGLVSLGEGEVRAQIQIGTQIINKQLGTCLGAEKRGDGEFWPARLMSCNKPYTRWRYLEGKLYNLQAKRCLGVREDFGFAFWPAMLVLSCDDPKYLV